MARRTPVSPKPACSGRKEVLSCRSRVTGTSSLDANSKTPLSAKAEYESLAVGGAARRRGREDRGAGDLRIRQVAAGVGGPGIAGGDLGAGTQAAGADVLEPAGAAAALEQVHAVLQAGHDRVAG